VGGQRRQLQERCSGVEQAVDAFAREQLAAIHVPLTRALAAPEADALELGVQILDQRLVRALIGYELL
jgi:hypothetical protein